MKEVTQQEFTTEVLQEKKPVLIKYYTTWCAPCKELTPVLEELSGEMDNVKFVKVNAEEAPQLSSNYGVRSVPTTILLVDGKEVLRVSGFHNKATMKQKIQEVL